MNLTSLLLDGDVWVPIEKVWGCLDANSKSKAFRMFEQGTLSCQGQPLLLDNNSNESDLGNVVGISVETWREADEDIWQKDALSGKKFRLHGIQAEDVITSIEVFNSETLKELVGFERPAVSVEEYDDRFLKSTSGKMGAKVWAAAAAALASTEVDPTAGKLVQYLLGKPDLWPKGELNDRDLKRHLSPFVAEYKKLSSLD